MELLKFVRRRSFLSEAIYTTLNLGLAVAVALTIYYTDTIWLGLTLVLLSKWRIFAVRPRFWYANILSNLVDIIVSVSVVMLMYTSTLATEGGGQELFLLGLMTLLYALWLLVLKPRSKRGFMVAQAAVAMGLGSWALFTTAYNWPVSITVIAMWLIGFSAARHVLSTFDDETYRMLLASIWGFFLAEIGWVAYHWGIAYSLPLTTSLLIPQVSIIVVLAGFVAYKAHNSFVHHQKIRVADILMPLLFSISVTLILLTVFNRVGTAI